MIQFIFIERPGPNFRMGAGKKSVRAAGIYTALMERQLKVDMERDLNHMKREGFEGTREAR